MIQDSTVERAWSAWIEAWTTSSGKEAMRAALEAVEGNLEQKIANDTVKESRRQGRCVTCGADFE